MTGDDILCIIETQEKRPVEKGKMKMITINTRAELVELLYGEDSSSPIDCPDTLVGIARIGGELLVEAIGSGMEIRNFFPFDDEDEFIGVDIAGNIVNDFIYY